MDDSPNKIIGDYELLDLMGTGAQGRVFKARCISSDNPKVPEGGLVALKVLNRATANRKEEIRFKRQADILATLKCPGICTYIDYFVCAEGEFDETKCLVLEYLDGEPLSERLKSFGRGLPWEDVEKIFISCLEGLIHASENGITHRDLKPSNIYITRDGEGKLIDFGIARHEGGEETSSGGWKGSFDYMAPDFVRLGGFRGDEISDIYSLTVCFFQALTGELPFPSLGEHAHLGYLSRWNEELPPSISFKSNKFRVLLHCKSLVRMGLSPDRENRYQSFSAMLEDLRKIRYRMVRHRGGEDYELIDLLGRGGFGEVFEGRCVRDGRIVAIKHLFSGRQSARFIKEAKVLQQYKHPDIVEYIDFIEVEGLGDDKEYFLVMEHLPGMPQADLRRRIKRSKTGLDVSEVVELFFHYLRALQYLHEHPRPIIHRDIKPGNLYAPPGHPEQGKIFDLGVARDVSGTLTTGMIPGTLDYMAPEFAKPGSDRGTPQSDLYALGVSLYEALTGRKPFPKLPRGDQEAFVQFVARAQKPLKVDYQASVFKQWPPLVSIVDNALAPDPKNRYAKASDMLKDLESMMQQGLDAGLDDDEALTRATRVNSKLLERIKNAAEEHVRRPDDEPEPVRKPNFVPPSEVETFLDPPEPDEPKEPARESRPRRKKKTAPRQRINPGKVAVGVIVVGLAGYGAYSVLRGVPASVARKEFTNFVAEQSVPLATTNYVDELEAMWIKAKEWESKDLMHSPFWREQIDALAHTAQDIPVAFEKAFEVAVKRADIASATELVNAWDSLDGRQDFIKRSQEQYIGQRDEMLVQLDVLEFHHAVSDMKKKLPDSIRVPEHVKIAEGVAKAYRVVFDETWKGVTEEESDAQLAVVRSKLVRNAKEYIDQLRSTAVRRYEALEDGDGQGQDLKSMGVHAPVLVGLVGNEYYDEAVAAVERAKALKEGKAGYAALVARIDKTIPVSIGSKSDLERIEKATGMLNDFLSTEWQGVDVLQLDVDAKRFREAIISSLTAYVEGLVATATERFQRLQDADTSWAALQAIEKTAPLATRLVKKTYDDSIRTVAALRLEKENKSAFVQATQAVTNAMPASIASSADLVQVETAAQAYKSFSEKDWTGINQAQVLQVGNRMRDVVARVGVTYVDDLKQTALAKLEKLEDASHEWDLLSGFATDAPALMSLLPGAYEAAVVGVAEARRVKESVVIFSTEKDRVIAAIPKVVTDEASLLEAEMACQIYAEFAAKTFDRIPMEDRDNAVRAMRNQLTELGDNYIAALKDGALKKFGKLEDASEWVVRLKEFQDKAPTLLRLVKRDYQQAIRVVATAQENKNNLAAYAVGLNKVRDNLPEQIVSQADVRRAEEAATAFVAFEATSWEGIDLAEQVEQKRRLREKLVKDAVSYVDGLQQVALAQLAEMQDPQKEMQLLDAFGREASTLSGLIVEKYDNAVRTVELADRRKRGMSEFTVALEKVYDLLQGEIGGIDDLAAKEEAHSLHAAMSTRTWAGVAEMERDDALGKIDASLTRSITAYVDRLRASAMEKFSALQDAPMEVREIESIGDMAPSLVKRITKHYDQVLADVHAASDRKDRLVAFRSALDQYDAKVPLSFDSAQDVVQAEEAVQFYQTLAAKNWIGVPENEVQQNLSQRRSALLDMASSRVNGLHRDATTKLDNFQSADEELQLLKEIGEKAPVLVGLLDHEYTDALRDVEQMRSAKMGLSDFRKTFARVERAIPADWSEEGQLAKAEKAAAALQTLAKRDWLHVPVAEKTETIERIRSILTERTEEVIAQLSYNATTAFQNLEDAEDVWLKLKGMKEQSPALVALAGDAYKNAVETVGAARATRIGVSEFHDALASLEAMVPSSISDTKQLAQAESAALLYADMVQREWTAISATEKREQLERVRSRLEEQIQAYMENLRTRAVEQYRSLQDGGEALQLLEELARTVPQLMALVKESYHVTLKEVEEARSRREGLLAFRSQLERVKALLPGTVMGLEDLRGAEKAVDAYQEMAAGDWPHVSANERNDSLSQVRKTMVTMINDYVGHLETKAVQQYEQGQDAGPILDELTAVSDEAPNLVGMVFNGYEESVKTVFQARNDMVQLVKKAEEQEAYTQLESAWEAIQTAWKSGDVPVIDNINLVLEASFEVDEFAKAYEEIRGELLEGIQSRTADSLATAQIAIDEYLAQLFQVDNPSFSGSYRSLSGQTSPLQIDLPPVENLKDLDVGVSYLELVRLEAWRLASKNLSTAETRRTLAESLAELSTDAKQRGFTALAGTTLLEAGLLKSKPQVFPGEYDGLTEPPGFLRWRAHATYQPEVSSLDVLDDLGNFATRGGNMNEYDLRLVMFAAYYSWRNAIDGEFTYARDVEQSFSKVLTRATSSDAKRAVDFMIGYIEEGPDGEEEYPGLYMMFAVSWIQPDSPVTQLAKEWMAENANVVPYRQRMDAIKAQTDLLQRLLR